MPRSGEVFEERHHYMRCTSERLPKRYTYDAAVGRLDELLELGVTAIEMMPITETPERAIGL